MQNKEQRDISVAKIPTPRWIDPAPVPRLAQS